MTTLEKVNVIIERHGRDSAQGQMARAIGVVLCTPSTRRHLIQTDPHAIMQAERALDVAVGESRALPLKPYCGTYPVAKDDPEYPAHKSAWRAVGVDIEAGQ